MKHPVPDVTARRDDKDLMKQTGRDKNEKDLKTPVGGKPKVEDRWIKDKVARNYLRRINLRDTKT